MQRLSTKAPIWRQDHVDTHNKTGLPEFFPCSLVAYISIERADVNMCYQGEHHVSNMVPAVLIDQMLIVLTAEQQLEVSSQKRTVLVLYYCVSTVLVLPEVARTW